MTAEILAEPGALEEIRAAEEEIVHGNVVRGVEAVRALAEQIGAPMRLASELPPAPKPPPAHDPTVPVWQSPGEEAYIPPLLAPDIPDEEDVPRKPCKHPAASIDENGVCECGEEMYS
jgi:hypothetical protein